MGWAGTYTTVRAFLPIDWARVFRWLFQTVMPTLLGKDYIERVRVIVTDGDSQETSQLDIAIALHFHNVCRGRCGWHVVDRGWIRCCPGVKSASRKSEKAFKVATTHIKNWIIAGCKVVARPRRNTRFRKRFWQLTYVILHLLTLQLSLWPNG
jgi:hypothetical protein